MLAQCRLEALANATIIEKTTHTRHAAAFEHASRSKDLKTVADCGDGLVLGEKLVDLTLAKELNHHSWYQAIEVSRTWLDVTW